MTKITLQGNEIHTNGNIPKVGDKAPDFILVDEELNNTHYWFIRFWKNSCSNA